MMHVVTLCYQIQMQGMSGRWLLSAFALVAGLAVITVTLAGLLRSHFADCTDGNERPSSACDRSDNRFALLRLGLETLGVSSRSSARNLPLFDMHAVLKEEDDFRCIVTATDPSTPLCIFLAQEDQFVSAQLESEGIWEPHIIDLYQQALRKFPQALIFDFGAHIGFYTLLAAAMGHHVIAVEPATDSCRRLVSSVKRANVSNLVTLVGAAVADVSYVPLVLDPKPGNKGGTRVHPAGKYTDKTLVNVITMDDLIELQPHGGVAIIKMDIEGYECKALAASANFFRTFTIPYVFMEWGVMFRDRHRYFSPCRPVDMRATSDALVALKYSAISTRNGVALDPQESATNWQVSDIVWTHAEAPQLSTYQ